MVCACLVLLFQHCRLDKCLSGSLLLVLSTRQGKRIRVMTDFPMIIADNIVHHHVPIYTCAYQSVRENGLSYGN